MIQHAEDPLMPYAATLAQSLTGVVNGVKSLLRRDASPQSASGLGRRAGAAHGSNLELRAVTKSFGDMKAVDNVSLKVNSGAFVTLLGPSGSGKTTTLMMIAGFQIPDAGEILLGGASITEVPPYRRDLGMVYQNYSLFPHMTVAKNIAFPLEMRGVAKARIKQRVAEALDLVRLAGLEERLPQQLSGGQQQRIALARALIFEPPVLLMDEPLGALDKKLREQMQAEIKQIQRKLGITTVYVTHDQEEALTMSDWVVVMNAGRIEQVGTPAEVYEQPCSRFVADFMGATNFFSAVVTEPGREAVVRTTHGSRFVVRGEDGWRVGDSLVLTVRPERIRLERLQTATAWNCGGTIDDVTYVGGQFRYHVVLAGGDNLVAVRPNLGDAAFNPGESVEVWWEPADARIVEMERA
jgi:spermidine/putrescine ABC transporter ATP-binding subunit